ncbi:MAG: LytR C-terminal domain-containing protein [Actinomycetia bacterium]|nr:LytR C-terminal domain-containing protein [Actinomycetes bacterium]
MNAGRHAARDSSFVRSAGGAMSRGIVLIIVAVVIGVLLIRTAVDDSTVAAVSSDSTTTTATPTTEVAAPDTTADTTADTTTDTADSVSDTTAATVPEPTVVEGTTDTTAADGSDPIFEPLPHAQVRVQVVNTTTVSGAAGTRTDALKPLGYQTLKPTNSASDAGTLALTKIHHASGYLLEAGRLAAELGLEDDSVFAMPDAPEALATEYEDPHLLVLLGTDLAG